MVLAVKCIWNHDFYKTLFPKMQAEQTKFFALKEDILYSSTLEILSLN